MKTEISTISTGTQTGVEAKEPVLTIGGRAILDEMFGKFGLTPSRMGTPDADIIEDWTTMLLWLTEKGVKREGLTKDENSVMLGILFVVAEHLARHAGEYTPFSMMLTVNAANRVFFAENPVRPLLLAEMAKRQRGSFLRDSACVGFSADIGRAIDSLFANKEEKERMKITIAVNGMMKSGRSVLG